MGARAHVLLAEFEDQISNKNILEIGSTPLVSPDENSTKFFSDYAERHQSLFVSVDRNEKMHDLNLRTVNERELKHTKFFCGDYKEVLSTNFPNEKFGLIYLDNFDYPPPGCEEADWFVFWYKQPYQELGTELTTENSAQAHLEQTIFVQDYVANKTIILYDDTFRIENVKIFREAINLNKSNYPANGWYGKGMTGVPWLVDRSWHLLDVTPINGRDDYQALSNFNFIKSEEV